MRAAALLVAVSAAAGAAVFPTTAFDGALCSSSFGVLKCACGTAYQCSEVGCCNEKTNCQDCIDDTGTHRWQRCWQCHAGDVCGSSVSPCIGKAQYITTVVLGSVLGALCCVGLMVGGFFAVQYLGALSRRCGDCPVR
eukprot:TRINITY_DN9633_c0_g1_i2.p2 TRINITY_DN9633_c0_g1~~TRINITY_DN9633_c0_g1_i2.p2  ORF type:complete len:156 (+),score=45.86 TRINITY_DN9633_c0_g1_i2:57-470(+)